MSTISRSTDPEMQAMIQGAIKDSAYLVLLNGNIVQQQLALRIIHEANLRLRELKGI